MRLSASTDPCLHCTVWEEKETSVPLHHVSEPATAFATGAGLTRAVLNFARPVVAITTMFSPLRDQALRHGACFAGVSGCTW